MVWRRVQAALGMGAALLLLTGCSTGTPTSPTSPRAGPLPTPRISRTRFLAFGDSLTAGTTSSAMSGHMGAGLPTSYPAKLLGLLSARYGDQTLIVENGGKPGERAETALTRFRDSLRVVQPEVVILLHGVNNLVDGAGGVAMASLAIEVMVHEAKVAGARVVLCTLLPQRPGELRAADPAVVASFNQRMQDVARSERVLVMDLAREFDVGLIGVDGLHPIVEGYARMAELFFVLLRAEFEQPPNLH